MNQLKKLRLTLALTETEMAPLMCCSQSRISDIETGKRGITKLMARHLAAIEYMHERGELWEFQKQFNAPD